jgi:predicted secreted Zn-dependent protease
MDWTVYGALIAGILAFSAAAAILVVRVLQGWRTLKRARRHLARSLETLATSAERTGDIVEEISDQRELEGSLARLRLATRQLNVLRAAVDEVTGSVGRVTAVYPRK